MLLQNGHENHPRHRLPHDNLPRHRLPHANCNSHADRRICSTARGGGDDSSPADDSCNTHVRVPSACHCTEPAALPHGTLRNGSLLRCPFCFPAKHLRSRFSNSTHGKTTPLLFTSPSTSRPPSPVPTSGKRLCFPHTNSIHYYPESVKRGRACCYLFSLAPL